MKDIIAALGAKRPAARAGRGETSLARFVFVLRTIALMAIGLLIAAPVAAQTGGGERWTDPTRSWSIAFVGSGMEQKTPASPPFAHYALVAGPVETTTEANFRICYVSQSEVDLPAGGADQIRRQAVNISETHAARLFPNERVYMVTRGEAGNVAFVDIWTYLDAGRTYRRRRMFSMSAGERGIVVELTCSWRASAPAERRNALHALFDSLVILNEPASAALRIDAQTGRWTEPTGAYSIDARGLVNRGAENERIIALFTVAGAPDGPPQHMCRVLQRVLSTDGPLPEARVDTLLRGAIPQTDASQTVRNLSETSVGGVNVLSYVMEFEGVIAHMRSFALPSARGHDHHELSCGGSTPFSDADWALLDSFLNSLEFTP